MGDLLNCIDATPFERLQPRFPVPRAGDRIVTLAVVSCLAMSTFLVVAMLAGPISRSSALVARHRDFDWLIFAYSRMGKSSGAMSSSMLRGTPG